MGESNGQNGKSRLDRIEEMIERNEALNERRMLANDAAHEAFEAEHRRLLTAQVLMHDAMKNMADGMTSLQLKVQQMADGMISLELKMEETTGKLNALIDTVDGMIRRPGEDAG